MADVTYISLLFLQEYCWVHPHLLCKFDPPSVLLPSPSVCSTLIDAYGTASSKTNQWYAGIELPQNHFWLASYLNYMVMSTWTKCAFTLWKVLVWHPCFAVHGCRQFSLTHMANQNRTVFSRGLLIQYLKWLVFPQCAQQCGADENQCVFRTLKHCKGFKSDPYMKKEHGNLYNRPPLISSMALHVTFLVMSHSVCAEQISGEMKGKRVVR